MRIAVLIDDAPPVDGQEDLDQVLAEFVVTGVAAGKRHAFGQDDDEFTIFTDVDNAKAFATWMKENNRGQVTDIVVELLDHDGRTEYGIPNDLAPGGPAL